MMSPALVSKKDMKKRLLTFSALFGLAFLCSCRSDGDGFFYGKEIQDLSTQGFVVTIVLLSILTVSWVTIGVYFILSRHRVKEKNRALVKVIDELNSRKKQTLVKQDKDLSEEYHRILTAVFEEKLYSQQQLGRDSFAEHMQISRKELNAILSSNTNGLSFPQWLNNIRLERACDMLQNEPGMTVSDIAEAVGLTPDNLRRIFRQQYGITPSEYREGGLT